MEKEHYIDEMEIDLYELLEIIKKNILLLIVIPIIAMLISGVVSFFILTPIYEASTTLIVGREFNQNIESEIEYSNLLAYQKLVKTYGEIAQSRTVSQEVIKRLDLDMSPEKLQSISSVTTVKDTELMKVSIRHPSPELAKDVANTLASVFSQRIVEIKKVDSVSVIDHAIIPKSPIKPNKKFNIVIAGFLGLMVALGITFLKEYLDKSIKSMADVERYLQLPILGAIPIMDAEDLNP